MKSSKKFLMRVLTGALAISMLAGTGICAAAVEDADFEGNAVVTAPDEETQDYVSKLDSIKAMLSQIAQGAYAKLSNTTAAQLIKIAQEAKMSQKIMIEAASQVAAIQSDASTKAAEIMAEAAEAVEGLEDEEQIAQIISQAEEQANAVTKEAEAQSAQIMAEAQAQSDALLADANAQLESIKAQFKGTAAQAIAEVQQKIEAAKAQIQAIAAKAGDFVAEKSVKVMTLNEGDFTFSISVGLKGVSAMATAYNGTEEEVTIPAYVKGKIPVAEARMFSTANIKTLNFPATMTHISGLCGVMFKELENMNVDEENPYYQSIDGIVYDKSGTVICAVPQGRDFAIPEGTKAIGDFAYYMSPMTSLEIPSSVEFIGMRSFGVCENLEEVVIPDSVISLGEGAFQYCANLKKVFIPANVQYVGDLAFESCSDELVIDLETISSQAYVYVRENGIEYNCPLAASISVEPDTSFVEDEEHFSAIELGTTLTVTGSADGGSKEGYTYAFYYKREGSTKWTCKQGFKDNDTITLTPAFTGNYQLCVKVKDSTGKVAKMYTDVFVKNAFENTSTISDETIKKGDTVTVNCSTNTNAPTAYAVY